MNINATFFVQIINFYIFYSIIRVFLFKPVVQLIDQDENAVLMANNLIDQLKKTIEINKKEQEYNRQLYDQYALNHCRNLEEYSMNNAVVHLKIDCSAQSEHYITSKEIELLAKEVQHIVEEKIKHVH